MNKLLIFLIGLILTGYGMAQEDLSSQKTAALPAVSIQDLWTYTTATASNDSCIINAEIAIVNNNPDGNNWLYPIQLKYFYQEKEIFNETIEDSSFDKFSIGKSFSAERKLDHDSNRRTEVRLISNAGRLIDAVDKYEPVYKFDRNQTKADIRLVAMGIWKPDQSPFAFLKDSHSTIFVLRNENETYAFKGTVTLGDPKISNLFFSQKVVIGPRGAATIKGPIVQERDLKLINMDIHTCPFC